MDVDLDKSYVYVFVRQDIPIWAQVVHCAHCVFHMARRYAIGTSGAPCLVIIGVADAEALAKVQAKLSDNYISRFSWTDPDESLGEMLLQRTFTDTEALGQFVDKWTERAKAEDRIKDYYFKIKKVGLGTQGPKENPVSKRKKRRNPGEAKFKVQYRGRRVLFATMEAAQRFAGEVFRKTGIVLGIEAFSPKARKKRRNPDTVFRDILRSPKTTARELEEMKARFEHHVRQKPGRQSPFSASYTAKEIAGYRRQLKAINKALAKKKRAGNPKRRVRIAGSRPPRKARSRKRAAGSKVKVITHGHQIKILGMPKSQQRKLANWMRRESGGRIKRG